MSLSDNTGIQVFPKTWILSCIKTYTKNHGKNPKVLVLAKEDLLDYRLGCTLPTPESLGVETITWGEYLESGQIDLAMGIKGK